jgi:hypothetical protein
MIRTISTYADIPAPKKSEPIIIRVHLYASYEKDPPTRLDLTKGMYDHSMAQIPWLTSIVESSGTILIDVTDFVRRKMAQETKSTKKPVKSVDIDIEIGLAIGSTKGILEVTAKSGRKKLAETSIEYGTEAVAMVDADIDGDCDRLVMQKEWS